MLTLNELRSIFFKYIIELYLRADENIVVNDDESGWCYKINYIIVDELSKNNYNLWSIIARIDRKED